jgi:hypothetical protein
MNAITTSPAECVSNDIALRNQLITTMMDEIRPMLWSFVLKYRLEFEEAYQHAAWLMLEVWHRLPDDCADVKAYLNATVRRGLYHMLKKNIDYDKLALSLEMARTESGASIGDTLEACQSVRTEDELDYLDKVTEAVYAALRECRTEEQEWARKNYGLENYIPVANERRAFRSKQVKQERDVRSIRRSVQGVLRKHPQVQALIQRETAVL